MKQLENFLVKVRTNLLEYYILALLSVGVPLIAFIYFDWKAAVSTFIIVQASICILAFTRGAN